MTDPLVASQDVERHGPLVRGLLVVAGALFALAFAALAAVMALLVAGPDRTGRPGPLAAAVAIAALFVAIAAYGASLVWRGVRGWSRRGPRFARANAWVMRHAYAFSLATSSVLAAGAIAQAGGPAAFLLSVAGELRVVWYGLLVVLVGPVHVALHEIGHAVAGQLVGFRFESLRVGDLVVAREAGRWRASFSPIEVSMLGLQLSFPGGDEATLSVRAAIRIVAGPLTTLLVAVACRTGAMAVAPATGVPSTIAVDVLRAAWWAGAAMGVANLLPFRTRAGLVSDGLQLLRTALPASPGARTARRAATLFAQGRRPRTWGLSTAALLEAAEATPRERGQLLVYALAVALDSGDDAGADAIVRRSIDAPPKEPSARYELGLQAAMLHALRGDAKVARAQLAAAVRGTTPLLPWYPKLADAMVLLAEGDAANARAALDAWRRGVAASGAGTALRAGGAWAEDALRARLAAEGPSGAVAAG